MTRVGIVAKSHLREATPHLIVIESWLASRGHDAVFETATAALMPAAANRKVADKPALVAAVDLLVVLGGVTRPFRVLWRPVSGSVGLAVSRRLQPGDRAWYVRASHADPVLVTARHGTRMSIATPDRDEPDEVLSVRRTRVLLLPAPPARPT